MKKLVRISLVSIVVLSIFISISSCSIFGKGGCNTCPKFNEIIPKEKPVNA